jgi:hypothetical protein
MKAGEVKRALVWAGILVMVGVLALIEVFVSLSPWVWVVLLVAAGAGAVAVYLTDRADWSLLIPAYVMFVVALLIVLTTLHVLLDDAAAVLVLIAIAIPFLVVFLRNRKQWWALIPSYVLVAVALMIGLEGAGILGEPLVAPFVLMAIAIPFLVVFLRNRKQWWALIPAYVLAAVALMIGLEGAGILREPLVAPYVLFAIAIPFFVVFARKPKRWWPLIPAVVLSIVGLSMLIAEDVGGYIGPLVLVAVGVTIAVRLLARRNRAVSDS